MATLHRTADSQLFCFDLYNIPRSSDSTVIIIYTLMQLNPITSFEGTRVFPSGM